jgi:hypothetical protein
VPSSVCTGISSVGLESVAPAASTRRESVRVWTDPCLVAANWQAPSLAGTGAGLMGSGSVSHDAD